MRPLLPALLLSGICAAIYAQDTPLQFVQVMIHNEEQARLDRRHFSYLSEERSTRTGGHLWKERVIELSDGNLHRLLAIDGRPLPPDRAAAEDRRIDALVADPSQFHRESQGRKDDELHELKMLQILPSAFLLSPTGQVRDGCDVVAFRPKPEFSPSTYEERVIHALVGTVAIERPANRLCGMDAKVSQEVDFGFGILGKVEPGGSFSFTRAPVDSVNWKTQRVGVHVQGRVLMMKGLSRDQESIRSDVRLIPDNLSLAEAAQLSRY